MKTQPYSAAGIRESESRANLKNKPVINSSKNRLYDLDGDFKDLIDRKETKIYALEILGIIKKAGKKGISGVNIRRKLNPDKIRMWDAAISLLCDDVETWNVLIPHYRYCVREVKPQVSKYEKHQNVFNQTMKPKAKFPIEAIPEKFRNGIS